jgi:redox-sensitive bicupin YhaK (pirin superfamily)
MIHKRNIVRIDNPAGMQGFSDAHYTTNALLYNSYIQDIPPSETACMDDDGIQIRVYSGSFAGLQAPMKADKPILVAEILMAPGMTFVEELPPNYSALIYVLGGSGNFGENCRVLNQQQLAWMDINEKARSSELTITAGNNGVRIIIYAALPEDLPMGDVNNVAS